MRKYMSITVVALIIIVGLILNVHASHHAGAMFSPKLSDMDTNNDNSIAFDEYSAFHEAQLRWSFKAIDTDNDGLISESEWNEFLKMHGFVSGHKMNKEG